MKRVQVYYNIRRGDYSVRQSGRVIDHVDSIILRDCRFNVAPAGREKVRATGVKNVHATVTGYTHYDMEWWQLLENIGERHLHHISYNPFKYDQFVKITSDGYDGFFTEHVHSADYVALLPNREIRAWGAK
tara:strand:- start:25 stop:417 length:393 start_codon:yes stop_codon:yes gene_type:complete